MRLTPRSLFGRNLLLIVVLIALAQISCALLVRELVLRPRLDQLAEGLARNIEAIQAGLASLPAAQRQSFVDAFDRRDSGSLGESVSDSSALLPLTALERRVVRTVSARVAGGGAEVIWRREEGGSLAIRLTLENRAYWVVLPGVLPAREFSGTWIAASLASALLALAGAFAIQRRINRPLSQVVAAAGELARGQTPQPLPEVGPTETAMLARSVNQLAASLAKADSERALMLAGVSHDLRTPLAKLRLGVEILADRHEPELTASMHRSVEEMDGIIGQFLTFARADTAEAMVEGDVNAQVQAIATAALDHGQRVELELGVVPRIQMREKALSRCIGNLVENAFRHGRPPVLVRTGEDAQSVWIEVRDHGAGIAASDVEALKQPFRRGLAARSGMPGAGLGLAIVDRLVRAQGGRLELTANVPRGLRARIALPR